MNRFRWKNDIPVIMISAENDQVFVVRAYKLGAVDYINRPFNSTIVRHKVDSIVKMHAKEQQLADVAAEQIIARHQNNSMMIHILSSIVEFRNGESGDHIIHVQTLTDMLMKELLNISEDYHISTQDRSLIPIAAAMHDIGKIAIPYKILNKPGKLDYEEFEIMKGHTVAGYNMLTSIDAYSEDPLVLMSAKVCRWHHERYDGNGYPDRLSGDEIPIAAQLVSVADVYDALTSERVDKPPFSHEKAIDMIIKGECGTFNPILMQCLVDLSDDIPARLDDISPDKLYNDEIHRIIEETIRPRNE